MILILHDFVGLIVLPRENTQADVGSEKSMVKSREISR